jgi:predicted enzyme related to lactoylglutathione lyase
LEFRDGAAGCVQCGVTLLVAGHILGIGAQGEFDVGGEAMGHKARVELVLDCAEPRSLAAFWCAALDYRDYYTDMNMAVLVPKDGMASPLILQGVPEAKAAKNRMHLDIVADDVETEIHRLEALGAHRIDRRVQSFGGIRWVRMSDPEQNEFCVSSGVEW